MLYEAFDTLSNANGARDKYVREVAERNRDRALLTSASSAKISSSSGAAGPPVKSSSLGAPGSRALLAAAAAAADAAEIEEQSKRRRLMLEEKRKAMMGSGTAQRAAIDPVQHDGVDGDGDDVRDGPSAASHVREKLKASKPIGKKRRPGMF